jgi:hypothetical protein
MTAAVADRPTTPNDAKDRRERLAELRRAETIRAYYRSQGLPVPALRVEPMQVGEHGVVYCTRARAGRQPPR